jgi:hypothetical protein
MDRVAEPAGSSAIENVIGLMDSGLLADQLEG